MTKTKKILGLDLGTNSIGWALINHNIDDRQGEIKGMGSRIIPMSQDILGNFDKGISISQTAERTGYRGVRRLYQRDNLRRERLHRVLNVLKFLPSHYAESIDFDHRKGQFKDGTEPKLNYQKTEEGKHEFIFKTSFDEMAKEFIKHGESGKIPYDWTIYFLRKKALTEKISKEELAWLLLNFNQKRGYYQLRGEEESEKEKEKEYCVLKVKEVIDSGENIKGKALHDVVFDNGWLYDRQVVKTEDWIGKTKEFIVSTTTTKNGDLKRTFKAVDSTVDWIAIKKKTEQDIGASKLTVGQYIYDALLKNPSQKIRGKLIKTIERKYYRKELEAILETQIEFHPELKSKNIYDQCVQELYPRNEAHQNNIKGKGFSYLIMEDIIFFQRPLKSKKSTISGCAYEYRTFKKTMDMGDGSKEIKSVTEPIKSIPKSNPLFQEFRLWQFVCNLKLIQKENEKGHLIDKDVTTELVESEEEWVGIFDFLSGKKEVEQKHIIDYLIKSGKILKARKSNYRWNYTEDKKYPCNETIVSFRTRLKKVKDIDMEVMFTPAVSQHLWHIIYSVRDIKEFENALGTFAKKYQIDESSFVENFIKYPPFPNEYGAYSLKAINKLLPLMRRGKYWDEGEITIEIKERIQDIIYRLTHIGFDPKKIDDQIVDDDIPQQVLKSFIPFQGKSPIQGLNTYQACYAVYDRHSESSNTAYWRQPEDITRYLHEFKQHSLRNPIVEQVVTETLRTVKDIWETHAAYKVVEGKRVYEKLFDEIHVELGREMKNSADKRKALTNRVSENENTNHRIRKILEELKSDPTMLGDIRPHSPSHQEILKIYEEGIYQSPNSDYGQLNEDGIAKMRKNANPTSAEITKYKLWMEQGYVSPYTGKTIPLSRLFTTDYQIEHIIPQSRYFDNSISNKVICESAVNAEKSNRTAFEFMSAIGGQMIALGQGNQVELFKLDQYEQHCNHYFKKNRTKLKNLLSEDVPDGFINRQLNDSRYISKLIKGLLTNLVREDKEMEATSKHVVTTPGAITSQLKNDWGLNHKWNELVAPRFKRLNEMTESHDFGYWDSKINAFRCEVPDDLKKGFNKKRIDHRHHALDALVIACTSKDHINYITSLNTNRGNHALVSKLRRIKEKQITDRKTKEKKIIKVADAYHQPWSNFVMDAKAMLEKTIISFKNNQRVINKTNNKTWQWIETKSVLKKQLVKQTKGDNWAIRKSLHKETVSGKVLLRRNKFVSINFAIDHCSVIVNNAFKSKIEEKVVHNDGDLNKVKLHFKNHPLHKNGKLISKLEVYEVATATRTLLTDKFTRKQLNSITGPEIIKILENHAKLYVDAQNKDHFELAFNHEGIQHLNKNIKALNNGKYHHPILKVRLYEVGKKFEVGQSGNKSDKFVEAAKGTNLFFAVYWNEEKGVRTYDSIPLNEVIEHQKQVSHLPANERTPVPTNPEKGLFLFALSPNELVYVPTDEEMTNPDLVDFKNLSIKQVNQVYKMVSCTGGECHFVPHTSAHEILKNEVGTNSKNERVQLTEDRPTMIDAKDKPVMIKQRCWKLKVDRLGEVIAL